jgi:hypothetical protein
MPSIQDFENEHRLVLVNLYCIKNEHNLYGNEHLRRFRKNISD